MKVFTDASFWGNPHQQKNANVGIFIPNLKIQFKEQIKVRDNNEAEYFAIFKAIQIISDNIYTSPDSDWRSALPIYRNVIGEYKNSVTIISDSKVCTYSLTQWVTTGIQRPNKYNNIQTKIIGLLKKINFKVNFIHQKAHSKFDGSINWIGNNIADKLSKHKTNDIDNEYFQKYLNMFNEMFFGLIKKEKEKCNDAWD